MNNQAVEKSGGTKSRDEAFLLLTEYTKNEGLVKHALSVEAVLRWYARRFQEDEELWGLTGLLHDFDYEKYPDPAPGGHPYVGCEILRQRGYPEIMIDAIMGHAVYTGTPRESLLSKTLFACDELVGLITAAVLVRPDRSLFTLTAQSVRKRMKDKAFARAVNREDILQGSAELGIELNEHIANCIEGMREAAQVLSLAGE